MKSLVSKKLINNFNKEWKKIIFSLILALFFWFSVSRLEYLEKKVYLPVSYKNLSTNYIIVEGMETNIAVIIKAKEDFFKNQNYSNLVKPTVYLENAKIGSYSYPVDVILTTPVEDISVKLQKEEIKLTIDEIITKEVEVKPNIVGIPMKGFFINELIIETNKIKIIGPKRIISPIDFVQTETISVENLKLEVITNVNILLPEFCFSSDKTNIKVEIYILPIVTNKE